MILLLKLKIPLSLGEWLGERSGGDLFLYLVERNLLIGDLERDRERDRERDTILSLLGGDFVQLLLQNKLSK